MEQLDAIIGFDFGTTSSKIIVQFPAIGDYEVINFENFGYKKIKYLLPTTIYFNEVENLFALEPFSSNNQTKYDLKVDLINNVDFNFGEENNLSTADFLLAYFYLSLKYAQNYIIKNEKYKKYSINWRINIGIPTGYFQNNNKSGKYFKILLLGWISMYLLSKNEHNDFIVSFCDIKKPLRNESKQLSEFIYKNFIIENKLNIIPEIIAEVASFYYSNLSREGLFFVLDIGGSTLDLAAFNYFRNRNEGYGQNYYAIFASDVSFFGTNKLNQERIDKFNSFNYQHMKPKKRIEINNFSDPLPEISYYFEFPRTELNDPNWEMKVLKKFVLEVTNFIMAVIKKVKNKNVNSITWREGIKFFICGGGKDLNIYKKIFENVGERLKESGWVSKYADQYITEIDIPVPEILKEHKDYYHRLAVAFGLSEDFELFKNIVTPDHIAELKINASKNYSTLSIKLDYGEQVEIENNLLAEINDTYNIIDTH